MNGLPDELVVGALRLPVTYRPDVRDEHNVPCMGLYEHSAARIHVDAELGANLMALILLHEACHALFELSPMRHQLDPRVEEAVVNVLSNGLAQVLRDNPRLREVLCG